MNKKLQVFVSSTYTDLVEERQAAVEAILDAGHIPAGMELFRAGKSQLRTIYKWIDESDVYMLILGGRYGSVEEDSGLSYTELEYRYALSKNMPVFTIVLEDSYLFIKAASKGANTIFEKDNPNKYSSFKNFVKTKIVKFVSDINQISSIIHSHLNSIIDDNDYKLVGWQRECAIIDNSEPEFNDKKIGKYTYGELVDTLQKKNFEGSLNALDYFISYYPKFYEGFVVGSVINKGLLGRFYMIGEDYIYKKMCPYYMAFDLLKYDNPKYFLSENGLYFYSLLAMDYDV